MQMGQKLKLFLSVLAGIVAGSLINTLLIEVGNKLITAPAGLDFTKEGDWGKAVQLSLLEPRHFVFPFLAHALGTFAGAYLATLLSPQEKIRMAFIVGGFFLTGGIIASIIIPAPGWFIVTDLLFAYIPMAYIAGRVYLKSISKTHKTKTT